MLEGTGYGISERTGLIDNQNQESCLRFRLSGDTFESF